MGNLEIEIETAKSCIWMHLAKLNIFVIELRLAACLFEKGYKHDQIRMALLNGTAPHAICSVPDTLLHGLFGSSRLAETEETGKSSVAETVASFTN